MHHLTVYGSGLVAVLPLSLEWSVTAKRPQASKMNLVGGMIRQFSSKQASLSAPAISAQVDADQATILDQIDQAGGRVYVSDGKHLYEAVLDAQITASNAPGKSQVNASFGIVRKVL